MGESGRRRALTLGTGAMGGGLMREGPSPYVSLHSAGFSKQIRETTHVANSPVIPLLQRADSWGTPGDIAGSKVTVISSGPGI